MLCLETMKGSGTVTTKDGKQFPVRYAVGVYQREVPLGTLEDPEAKIVGLKEVRGKVEPMRFLGETLTLEMQDGRKMSFFFSDTAGDIAFKSWID